MKNLKSTLTKTDSQPSKKKRKSKMDIRKHRFLPKISTSSKIFIDKKKKQKNRRFLNDKRNWDN